MDFEELIGEDVKIYSMHRNAYIDATVESVKARPGKAPLLSVNYEGNTEFYDPFWLCNSSGTHNAKKYLDDARERDLARREWQRANPHLADLRLPTSSSSARTSHAPETAYRLNGFVGIDACGFRLGFGSVSNNRYAASGIVIGDSLITFG